jgi:hypothetical protein
MKLNGMFCKTEKKTGERKKYIPAGGIYVAACWSRL